MKFLGTLPICTTAYDFDGGPRRPLNLLRPRPFYPPGALDVSSSNRRLPNVISARQPSQQGTATRCRHCVNSTRRRNRSCLDYLPSSALSSLCSRFHPLLRRQRSLFSSPRQPRRKTQGCLAISCRCSRLRPAST